MKIKKILKENLSTNRYNHIISVANTSKNLANIYNINIEKSYTAALLHDFTKEYPLDKQKDIMDKYFKDTEAYNIIPAWHSYTASIVVKEDFDIHDEDILNAIKYHTLGNKNMNDIAKIVFISDYIEPLRKYIDTKYYDSLIGKITLDELLLDVLTKKITYLKNKNNYIPKQTLELEEELKKRLIK